MAAYHQVSDYRDQINSSTNDAFHCARKLVFTSFPVGNIVPLKSEMLYFQMGNSGILRAPRLPTRKHELGNALTKYLHYCFEYLPTYYATFTNICQLIYLLVFNTDNIWSNSHKQDPTFVTELTTSINCYLPLIMIFGRSLNGCISSLSTSLADIVSGKLCKAPINK